MNTSLIPGKLYFLNKNNKWAWGINGDILYYTDCIMSRYTCDILFFYGHEMKFGFNKYNFAFKTKTIYGLFSENDIKKFLYDWDIV